MKKKNIILLIIAIVLFILVGSTMAYFGWSSSLENKDQLVDVTVSGGTGSCDKLEDNEKLLYPTSTREKGRILKVKAKQQMATNATITWNLVINSINESTLTTSGLKHSSFKYELVNDTTAVSYGTGNFENVTNGTTITLSTDKETLDYNTEYTFILYLWIDGTIGNNPLDMANQPYNFDLNCNITGTSTKITPPVPSNVAQYIKYQYNNSSKTEVTNNSITYQYDTTNSLMADTAGNIRYYGASPNNYIYFNCETYPDTNCETWRIIGTFDGKVKIMRNESIGSLAWDQDKNIDSSKATYDNDWSTASLKVLLNEKYYNGDTAGTITYYSGNTGTTTTSLNMTNLGIKNDTTRNMIAEVTWNLGGHNNASVYPDTIYEKERGTTVYSERPTTWTGKIALAYPSDYGYAADLSLCNQTLSNYNNSTCTANNWMKNILGTSSHSWLLIPHITIKTGVLLIHSNGAVIPSVLGNMNIGIVYSALDVTPTLYLSSELSIASGNGSSSNPYKLNV